MLVADGASHFRATKRGDGYSYIMSLQAQALLERWDTTLVNTLAVFKGSKAEK